MLGEEDFVKKVRRQVEHRPAIWSRNLGGRDHPKGSQRQVTGDFGRRTRWEAVDVAKEEGYKNGSGVCQTLKRLENRALKNRVLKMKWIK